MEAQRVRISVEFSLPEVTGGCVGITREELEECIRTLPGSIAGRMIDVMCSMGIETEAVQIQRIPRRSILPTR